MRIHKGTYGKETMESNALVTNLLKYPEIASTLIRQYPQYSLTYFVDGSSRFAKEDIIGDNKFSWPILGRTNRPSTCTGVNVGNGLGLTQFSVEFEENYLNPNDVVRFKDSNQAIVKGEATVSPTGGYVYQMTLQGADAGKSVSAVALAAGATVGKVGTAFGEHSERGYENHVYPDWYTNYIGICRKSKSISGDALTDVSWIEGPSGQRLWYFTDEQIMMEDFYYELELEAWYGETTMDANGNPTVFDTDGKPIVKGDGILRQIDAANVDTYSSSSDLTEERLTDFLAQLGLNTGIKNAEWIVFTGTGGKVAFHNAMKQFVMDTGNLIYDARTGRNDFNVGVHFTTYNALGHKLTLVHNPLFDDQNIHTDLDAQSGMPKESFRMVFLNMGVTNGVSNIERKVKGAGGINRSMIVKYLPGMVNPFDQKSMTAVTSRDGFSCEVLSHSGIIVRNPLSCGQLRLV